MNKNLYYKTVAMIKSLDNLEYHMTLKGTSEPESIPITKEQISIINDALKNTIPEMKNRSAEKQAEEIISLVNNANYEISSLFYKNEDGEDFPYKAAEDMMKIMNRLYFNIWRLYEGKEIRRTF